MGSELATGFDCEVCGKHHEVLPLSYSVKAPAAMLAVSDTEWNERVMMTPDQCVIDNRSFFLRGRIAVPIGRAGRAVYLGSVGGGRAEEFPPDE